MADLPPPAGRIVTARFDAVRGYFAFLIQLAGFEIDRIDMTGDDSIFCNLTRLENYIFRAVAAVAAEPDPYVDMLRQPGCLSG